MTNIIAPWTQEPVWWREQFSFLCFGGKNYFLWELIAMTDDEYLLSDTDIIGIDSTDWYVSRLVLPANTFTKTTIVWEKISF